MKTRLLSFFLCWIFLTTNGWALARTNGTSGDFVGPPASTEPCLTIQCPTNGLVVFYCTNAPVFYTVLVTDTCTTNVTLVCNPPPGSYFPTNTYSLVVCSATDILGNTASCTFVFTVMVLQPDPTIGIVGTNIVVTWQGGCGVLQEASDLSGPWTDLPTATSPYIIPMPVTGTKFYRLKFD